MSTVQIDFGHRTVDVTVSDLRRWSHSDASAADIGEARRAFKFKDTPDALRALRELIADVARQTPGARRFTCLSCGCATYGAPDVIGPELCEPCYELAGIDNACNDNGREPDDSECEEIHAHLRTITASGGDAMRALSSCDYIAPTIDAQLDNNGLAS